jgi:hypothetical protein
VNPDAAACAPVSPLGASAFVKPNTVPFVVGFVVCISVSW